MDLVTHVRRIGHPACHFDVDTYVFDESLVVTVLVAMSKRMRCTNLEKPAGDEYGHRERKTEGESCINYGCG